LRQLQVEQLPGQQLLKMVKHVAPEAASCDGGHLGILVEESQKLLIEHRQIKTSIFSTLHLWIQGVFAFSVPVSPVTAEVPLQRRRFHAQLLHQAFYAATATKPAQWPRRCESLRNGLGGLGGLPRYLLYLTWPLAEPGKDFLLFCEERWSKQCLSRSRRECNTEFPIMYSQILSIWGHYIRLQHIFLYDYRYNYVYMIYMII